MSRSVKLDTETLRERQARAQECHVPSPWDLLGIAPDWTGGMSTEDWMDQERADDYERNEHQ